MLLNKLPKNLNTSIKDENKNFRHVVEFHNANFITVITIKLHLKL